MLICPHCAVQLTPEEIRSLVGKLNASLRRKPGRKGGRPRTEAKRCPCGAMTAKRAAARGHRCQQ